MTAQLGADTCIVCGTVGASHVVLDGLVRRCPNCTFNWTAGGLRPVEELYDSSYFEGAGYEDYYQPEARRFESGLRLRWLRSTGEVGTLLEAGSAAGFFVEAAIAAGIDARGVEVSESAAAYARDRLGVPVQQGLFESASFGGQFDVVCAFHVLEHVEDPLEFFQAARARLVPGGRLGIEVPNISSAAAGRLGAGWPNIQPEYHRWHFTPASLIRLANDSGFDVVRQDTVFSRFYWRPIRRLRHPHSLLLADWVASGSVKLAHPTMGDCLRLIARPNGSRGRR